MELNNSLYSNKLNHKIKRQFTIILIVLSVVQQMPLVKDLYYSQIRLVLYVLFTVFVVTSLVSFDKILSYRIIKIFSIVVVYNLILYAITQNTINFNVFEIIVPFGILVCSLNTRFSYEQIVKLLKLYVVIVAILGVSSVLYYGGSFVITQRYFLAFKNQIGPLIGIAAIITEVWILKNKNITLKERILAIIIFISLISSIIVIRNRAGMVGILIASFFLLISDLKTKKSLRFYLVLQFSVILAFIMLLLGAFDNIFDVIIKSFILNYDISDLNSLSAGRTNVYFYAMKFISEHPIIGELSGASFIDSTPHNYILKKCVEFGLLGASLFLILYLYLWNFTVKNLFFRKSKYLYGIPFWIMFFSLIVSIFEYTYPYGPGVSQLMVWFLLGQQLYSMKNATQKLRGDNDELHRI